ncbi:MAG: hypothetical protein KC646_10720 [Candidatus Cloacimonetes bacterium]|nr:hypothetical protein [Candidatus Cloacimonadota bacterium]
MDDQIVRNTVAKLFSTDRELRLETLKEISIADMPAYDKALVYFFRSDPSIEEKIICIRSFHNFDREGVLECIEDASVDEYYEIRLSAFKRVAKLKTDQDLIKYSYILLRGLLDSHAENLAFCLEIFQSSKLKDKLSQLIAIHYDQNNPSSCLATLFLIYELNLSDQLFVLETCLNHEDSRVSSYAVKLLPLYIKKFPHLKDLEVRTRVIDTEEVDLKQLSTTLKDKDITKVVDYLIKLRKLPKTMLTTEVLDCLLSHLKDEINPFIIATIIKTLPCFENFKAYDEICEYLLHEDQRVVANCVECLSDQGDKRVLEFIALKIAHLDYSNKEDLRIISGAMKVLRKYEPNLALQYMRGLTVANDHAVYTYLHDVREWDDDQLLESVFLLLSRENRVRIVSSLCNYFKKHSDLASFRLFINLINHTTDTEKRKVLVDCYSELLGKYQDEELPILVDRSDPFYNELKPSSKLSFNKRLILFSLVAIVCISIWVAYVLPTSRPVVETVKVVPTLLKIGDEVTLKAKVVNQDKQYYYIESEGKYYQIEKASQYDFLIDDIVDIQVEYIKKTKFSGVKVLKILSVNSVNQ